MVPKGNNIGLDTRERRAWVRKAIEEVLAAHGLYEQYPAMVAADEEVEKRFFSLPAERQKAILDVSISPGYLDAFKRSFEADEGARRVKSGELAYVILTASGYNKDADDILIDATRLARRKAIEDVGINHLVSYIFPRVFSGADEDEEHCLNHMTLPCPMEAPTVIRAAKPHMLDGNVRFEAIDAAFGATRKRHVSSYLYPFMQDCVVGQPGLGRFVRRHMAGSSPDQVAQAIRMRKHAIDKGELGNSVADNPKAIAAYYCDTILDSFDRAAVPEGIVPLVCEMLMRGEGDNEIKKVIRMSTLSSNGQQTIPPSSVEFDGVLFEVVPKGHPLVMRAGDINDSCMTLGGAAGDCVLDVLANPRAFLMVIRRKFFSVEPKVFLNVLEDDAVRSHFAEMLAAGKMKMSPHLKDEGYVGYCYCRHGLSGTIYVDNVELNASMLTPEVSSGLAKWVRWVMGEANAPRVYVGKAYSCGILDGHGFSDAVVSKKTLMADMPDGSCDYADICGKSGAWEATAHAVDGDAIPMAVDSGGVTWHNVPVT